jgi:hypothetical protein
VGVELQAHGDLLTVETLNKSILDFSAAGNTKCDLVLPFKIKRLPRSILAVRPCIAGSAE